MFTNLLQSSSLLRTFIMVACMFVFAMSMLSITAQKAAAAEIGDTVETIVGPLPVKLSPIGVTLQTQDQGATGVVVEKSFIEEEDGTQIDWIDVDFENDPDGWVQVGAIRVTVAASANVVALDNSEATTDAPASTNTSTTVADPLANNTFVLGDVVRVNTDTLNVRPAPSADATLGTQSSGAEGTITDDPVVAGEYVWVFIDYVSGADGWSATSFLTEISALTNTATAEPVVDTTTAAPTDTPAPASDEDVRISALQTQLAQLQEIVAGLVAALGGVNGSEVTSDSSDTATDFSVFDDIAEAADDDTTDTPDFTAEDDFVFDEAAEETAERGKGIIYRDGSKISTLTDRTRQSVRQRCRTLATNVPTQGYRCTWKGEEVFSKGDVLIHVDGVRVVREAGRARLTAFQQCRLQVERNEGSRVVCKWQGQTLLATGDAGDDKSVSDILTGIQNTRTRTAEQREAADDETVVYKNGSVHVRQSGLDRQGAIDLCAELSDRSPKQGFRCTFDGRVVATHGHLRVNDRSGTMPPIRMAGFGFLQNGTTDEVWYKTGLGENQAIDECRRVYLTGEAEIQCYWHNGTGPGSIKGFISDGTRTNGTFNGGPSGFFIDNSPGGGDASGVGNGEGFGGEAQGDPSVDGSTGGAADF